MGVCASTALMYVEVGYNLDIPWKNSSTPFTAPMASTADPFFPSDDDGLSDSYKLQRNHVVC